MALNSSVLITENQTKKIILVMPTMCGFSDLMIKNFEKYGFEVTFLTLREFKYKNIFERINKFFRAAFLNDKKYKERIMQNKMMIETLNRISGDYYANYSLIIRADSYPIEAIMHIKTHCGRLVGYQWDGIDNYPNIFSRIKLFDRFFVFHPDDRNKYQNYDFEVTQNFYFDIVKPSKKVYNQHQPILYSLLFHNKDKLSAIRNFLTVALQLKIEVLFLVGGVKNIRQKNLYNGLPVTFINEHINYSLNLEYVDEADVLIDFVYSGHKGLSLRFFEGIHYQRKVITNNAEVFKYDFYHPDNILVWDGINLDQVTLQNFLKAQYHELPIAVMQKYAFGNWIKQVLVDN